MMMIVMMMMMMMMMISRFQRGDHVETAAATRPTLALRAPTRLMFDLHHAGPPTNRHRVDQALPRDEIQGKLRRQVRQT